MSVASKNPFALLDDDVSEEVTKAAAPAEPQPQVDAAAPATQARSNREQKSRGGPASRGGKYYQRGGAKSVSKDTPEQDQETTPREFKRADGEYRGRGRGGRDGRGGGRGGRGRGRGREFDRHSGTLPDSDKKVNQGWGANEGNAELNAEEQAAADVVVDNSGWAADINTTEDVAAGDGWGGGADEVKIDAPTDNAANGTAAESRRANNKEDEDDNLLTLDEYFAKKASLTVPKLDSVRKANEGSDESTWKDVVPLSKEREGDNYFIGKTKAPPKARTKKEDKVLIEIDAHFERPSRPGGRGRGGQPGDRDRSDRGRGSGGGRGRGRGGPRGEPRGEFRSGGDDAAQQAVNVEDEAAFPSLS